MQRRTLLAWAATGAAHSATPALAQVLDMRDAVDKAGRQRMLSQRMSKAYLAIVCQVQAGHAAQVMDRSMALFDRQLTELKAYAPQNDIRATYGALETAWGPYKSELVGTAPSKARAAALLQFDQQLLALAHKGTAQLEAASGLPDARTVNLAGRQRMLSQRMAKFYMAAALQIDAGAARAEIERSRAEFTAALQTLRQAAGAQPRIRDALDMGEQQWVFFDAALQKVHSAGNDPKALSEVFTTSEHLLTIMDRVTTLFATTA